MKRLGFLFLLLLPSLLYAQSSLRSKVMIVDSVFVNFDTLSIIPNSLTVTSNSILIPDSNYQIQYFQASLFFKNKNYLHQKIKLQYQVFDFNLSNPIFHKDIKLVENRQITSINQFSMNQTTVQNSWFDNATDLTKTGSVTRGISIGNKQDVVVNSDLNLQLDGAIFDDFFIKAVISDKNIPLQPEGNTQQIQEFDKVFIQLYNKIVKITAGDFDIITPPTNFLKASKKVLGVNVDYKTVFLDSNTFITSTAIAMTKGKFSRLQITPIEGNQGPYRLVSENGDANIVIIGGSERVFFNGVLLQRGLNNDYAIDYNIGEIVFTSKTLIARESKIVIEFEYTDRHYSRSVVSSFNTWKNKKLSVSLDIYSEQDLKNQSVQPELTTEQKMILRNAGEQFDQMISPAFDSVTFNSNQVRYKLIDTLVNTIRYDTVFVYSTNPDSAFYALSFTYLGANQGNYILLNNTVNGRVFAWTAPINGIPQGLYNPVLVLVPPQKKQMIVSKIDYQITKNSLINVELAISNFDKNTFSSIGNSTNSGGAIITQYTNNYFFNAIDTLPKNKLTSKFTIEYNSKKFSYIEPNKTSEFYRQLNIQQNQFASSSMMFVSADFLFERKNRSNLQYSVHFLQYENQYNGLQQMWNGLLTYTYVDFHTDGFYTNSSASQSLSNYLKTNNVARIKLPFLYLGLKLESENNALFFKNKDSIVPSSIALAKYEVFLSSPDSAKIKYKIWSNSKSVQSPLSNLMVDFSKTNETGVSLDFQGKKQSINLNSIYREVTYTSSFTDQNEYAFISNISHQAKFAKSSLIINTYYQTASGREQKKEYQYVKVAKGQGQYIWTDFNNNSVEDLDEFSITPYSDQGEYVRIWILSNDYVKTYSNEFNQTIFINPGQVFTKKNTFHKVISLLKNQSSILLNNKTSAGPEIGVNPFVLDLNDQKIVSASRSLRNDFTINQANPIWNVQYIYNNMYNKLFLASGFESKNQQSNALLFRLSLLKKISNKFELGIIDKINSSEFLDNRNYQILQHYFETSISFLKTTNFRSSIVYRYSEKVSNYLFENKTSFFNQFNLDIQYNLPNKGFFSGKITAINVLFNQDKNTPLALEVLEGLSSGLNFIFNFSFQTIIAKNIQLNTLYEMRVSPNKSIVHTGNISIRAFF